MRVLAYKAENYKGLKRVSFEPGPHVVLIVGPNGAGKSSVIDALVDTLRGAASSPDMPVRRGEAKALCNLDLGELKVSRKWSPEGETRLYVENADGTKPRSPQALLDSLVGAVAFDPLEFARKPPRDQAKALRDLAGLGPEFEKADSEIASIKEERSEVARSVRLDEGALSSYPDVEFEGVPDEAPSVDELVAAYQEAVDEKAENDAVRSASVADENKVESAAAARDSALIRRDELKRQLDEAEKTYQETKEAYSEAVRVSEESWGMVKGLVDPDLDSFISRISKASSVAAKVARKRERDDIRARWVANREHSMSLTSRITKLEDHKKDLMLRAPLPVPGLDCTGDEVFLDGIPVSQLNTASQLKLWLSVSSAMNPKLRVAIVRDGSLLDDEGLKAVWDWAVSSDMQVFVERVGNQDSPEGLIIEDGELVEDRQRNHE